MLPEPKFLSRLLARLDHWFENRSKNSILLICLVLSILIGGLDFKGSSGLLIFYVAPIAVAGWYGGKRVGAVIAVYCAAAWFVAVSLFAPVHDFSPIAVLSLIARLAMFLVLTNVIARLRETMRQQRELMEFIVHDLRSPISSSITGLLTLQETADSWHQEEREMVQLSLISNQRALGLVNSMLDVARLETGKMPIQLQKVALDHLIGACFDQVSLWAKSSEVRLVSDVQVFQACLDPDLTSRVIVNLISNALKFSPPGADVKVSATAGGHGSIRFAVQDSGPGIPPDYVETIFDPFAQVKGTRGGTGLGLTFCRLAIHAQGGKIWVESHLGKGTIMHFTLPGRTLSETHAAPAVDTA
jgi:signal transduction histidine kinase